MRLAEEENMKKQIIALFFILFVYSCSDRRETIGDEIYMKIVQYQKTNGRLPDKLNDIGIEEEIFFASESLCHIKHT